MKLWILLAIFISLMASAAGSKVDYKTFQEMLADPAFQKMLRSSNGQKIINSYRPGMPKNKMEFIRFKKSMAFWKLKRTAEFKRLTGAAETSVPVMPTVAPVATKKAKTQKELYLEQFMDSQKSKNSEENSDQVAPKKEEVISEDDQLEDELNQIAQQNKKVLELVKPGKDGQIDMNAAQNLLEGNMAGTVVEGEEASPFKNPDVVVARLLIPFQQQSVEEIEADLSKAAEGGIVAKIYQYIPKLPLFLARLLHSKEALPTMAKIGIDKKRLTLYVGLNFATIILGFILKRLTATELKFSKQVKHFFGRVFVLNIIRIFLLVYFFQEEFAPAAKIFMNTFF